MKTRALEQSRGRNGGLAGSGFTLIELLVVIAVIALLAGMIFPITGAVNRAKIRTKAKAELGQVETAIVNYKTKLGHYPPDSGNVYLNQLYYELAGTSLDNNNLFTTLDQSSTISAANLSTIFGGRVTGFINSTRPSADDEGSKATAFLKGLKPGQTATLGTLNDLRVLTCSVPWPESRPPLILSQPGVNPWRYNSSMPTNNPGSFDLWVDVLINGKLFRISNWSKEPIQVTAP